MSDIVSVDFDAILTAFEHDGTTVRAPERSALEDECVAAAQRGWHACSPSAVWPTAAEHAVRGYVRDELTDDVLESHAHGASRWALFASYALGWVFSLKHRGHLDEMSADHAVATLPGFMWMEEERISGPEPSTES